MNRLTKYVTPVGVIITDINSMKHYKPCIACKESVAVDFSTCKTCELKLLFNKLKEYEDLEEQGRLRKLSYGIGDEVYLMTDCYSLRKTPDGCPYKAEGKCPYKKKNACEENRLVKTLFKDKVKDIRSVRCGWYVEFENNASIMPVFDYDEGFLTTMAELERRIQELGMEKSEVIKIIEGGNIKNE